MNYGLSYQGSKSKMAEDLLRFFPSADNFYDLFGGGFAVTHAMIKHRSKSFKQFHFNEIRKGMSELIKDAIAGKYNYNRYQMPWVSREEFFAKKEDDLFIKIIWSFGNNGDSYLFGKEIEAQKRSLHQAIVFNLFDNYAREVLGLDRFKDGISITDRRLYLKNRIKVLGEKRLELQQLERLERLQQLEQLQQLQQLEQLCFYNTDYRQVHIKENSVVYCDIPYAGTGKYDDNKNFNHKDFFNWAASVEHPVFISEYNVSDQRFTQVWKKDVRTSMCGGSATKAVEKLYCNKLAYKKLLLEKLKRK